MTNLFDANSTADEVLRGVDLRGRRVLITGASAGIGLETARSLLAHGASVIGTARNVLSARSVAQSITADLGRDVDFRFIELDLSSLSSVRSCADKILKGGKPLAAIIANAGLMAGPRAETAEGFEAQFGINFLGHFVLTGRLTGLLKPGSRVVTVSSAGHRRADVDLADLNFVSKPYDPYLAYGQSKTATILFAVEFDRRHRADGIRATAVNPGAIKTDTVLKMLDKLGSGKEAAMAAYDWKSPQQGAATTVWAGFVAPAEEIGSKYCEDCHVAQVKDNPAAKNGVRSYALDPESALNLWSKAGGLVQERFDSK